MRFPPNTPATVRRAVRNYVWLRRLIVLIAIIAGALAIVGLTILGGMLLDRFREWPESWRQAGPLVALCLAGLGGLLALAWLILWKPRPLSIAIAIDQQLPEREDRWSTALDLATRAAAEQPTGQPESVARVYEEAAATRPTGIAAIVPKRELLRAGVVLLLVLLGFGLVHASATFDLPLLWSRFWGPTLNLPRDSYTQIHLLPDGETLNRHTLPTLREDSPFELRVKLTDRRPGVDPDRQPPVLERLTADGVQPHEFGRVRGEWVCRLPRVTESFRFRVRAGDGLTAVYQVPVASRIHLEEIRHSVRYPRYAKLPDIDDQPLTTKRLGLLVESRLTLSITCDTPYTEFTATFEPLPKGGAAEQVLSRDELLKVGRGTPAPAEATGVRRGLRVTRRGDRGARLTLNVSEGGIVRLQATGENGQPSLPWVLVVEAVADAPPRLTVTGIEADTTIVPGELVAFQYRAEDDLAIDDLILAWWTAGGATTGNLAGEEYVRSDDFGKPLVAGEELIQRMNYHVYATQPFEFQLIAIDSKGQESKTEKYRIHIIDDDHASRFADALEFIANEVSTANLLLTRYRELTNQLNIIATATEGQSRWPAGQDALRDELKRLASILSGGYIADRNYFTQRYAGFPWRTDRAIVRLLAARRMIPTRDVFTDLADQLDTTDDLPALIAAMRAAIATGTELTELHRAAAQAELERFAIEGAMQRARKLAQRLTSLQTMNPAEALYAANLQFYLDELAQILKVVEAQPEVPGTARLLPQLRVAHHSAEPWQIVPLLKDLIAALADYRPPPSDAARQLTDRLAELAATSAEHATHFRAVVGDIIRARGQESLLPMADLLQLGPEAVGDAMPSQPGWYEPPLPAVGARLLIDDLVAQLEQFGTDIQVDRYELNPPAMDDRAAGLRELAIGVAAQVERCHDLPATEREWLLTTLHRFTFLDIVHGPDDTFLRKLREARPVDATIPDQPFGAIAESLRETADFADRHAARLQARLAQGNIDADELARRRAAWGREAGELQLRLEGAEATFRAAFHLRLRQTLATGEPPEWETWADWHGLQLALTTLALRAQELVYGRHFSDVRKVDDLARHVAVTAGNATALAADLRTYAALLDRLAAGQPGNHDFGPIVKESKTTGFLPQLEAEYAFLRPFLKQPMPAIAPEARDQLASSQLGRIIRHEQLLVALSDMRWHLHPRRSPPLERLGDLTAPLGDGALDQALAAARRAIDADAPDEAVIDRRLTELRQHLDGTIEQLKTQVRLPPVNVIGRENRRFTADRGVPYLWTIQALVDNADRRWLERLQQQELALIREVVRRAYAIDTTRVDHLAIAEAYARLVELRARNLANEQRRNRGIELLQPDGGPSIRLPAHIASEFMKARGRQAPTLFQKPIEDYQNTLYQALAPP